MTVIKPGENAFAELASYKVADKDVFAYPIAVGKRIYVRDAARWELVARAHGRAFGTVMPANTLVEVSNLIGDYEVEIEAEAVIG